ncbi:hypothetical protein FDP41_006357 [Naegleria fowleri]|uniref:Uncharacterized protein n=1 Tax=Naegleria fowleri TaxID=5763 RepID=A0A6A5B9S3_NAEFO|nr:uncharacterized protein FDP41_006357 [Naegleria fowleri]KAF0974883.1 hypothetical protein FDP41_006357 [Naegleria fowleri]CAG4707941.1 unnamed protein product [Naegleria fowleri]
MHSTRIRHSFFENIDSLVDGNEAQLCLLAQITTDILEAAGVLHGTLKGCSITHIKQAMEQTENIPLLREKLKTLFSDRYENVTLILDKDGPQWSPTRRFKFRVWKNNRDQFDGTDDIDSVFGEEYRAYFEKVSALKKFE